MIFSDIAQKFSFAFSKYLMQSYIHKIFLFISATIAQSKAGHETFDSSKTSVKSILGFVNLMRQAHLEEGTLTEHFVSGKDLTKSSESSKNKKKIRIVI